MFKPKFRFTYDEINIIIRALIELKNQLIAEGRYTDAVDDLLIKLVDSGVDKNFPRGYEDQAERLDKKKDLYECVVSTKSRNIKESELKDGDIIRYRRNNGGAHIFIYTGGKIKHAGIAKWYPRTTSPDSRLKISGKKQIWVYRVKD